MKSSSRGPHGGRRKPGGPNANPSRPFREKQGGHAHRNGGPKAANRGKPTSDSGGPRGADRRFDDASGSRGNGRGRPGGKRHDERGGPNFANAPDRREAKGHGRPNFDSENPARGKFDRRDAKRRDGPNEERPPRRFDEDRREQRRRGPRREIPDREARDQHAREGRDSSARWIYGRHAGLAALANPDRKVKRILVAEAAQAWLRDAALPPERLQLVQRRELREIDMMLHEGAVHQGIAVEVEGLPRARLKEACQVDHRRRPVVVLDQITDPHNIGAIFRSAAAFGAAAVIAQDRRTPPLAGALAKAAAGAVELVPCVEVVNIARALEGLKGLGYVCLGLASEAARAMSDAPRDRPVALVLGAEGAGLRRLVQETCDEIVRIPIDLRMESLNVSTACAVALYEISKAAAPDKENA